MSLVQPNVPEQLRLNPTTTAALTEFARRRVRLLKLRAVAVGLVAFVLTMLIVAACDHIWLLPELARWILSLCAYGVTCALTWWFGWRAADRKDVRRIARQFESAVPRFNEQLLSAVELSEPESSNGSDRFRQWLQDQTARRVAGIDVRTLLPLELIRPWLAAAVVVVLATIFLLLVPKVQFGRRLARAILPGAAIQRAALTQIQITKPSPASDSVAEGDTIGVVAKISGPNGQDARLQWRTGRDVIDELPMSPQRIGDSSLDVYSAILAIRDVPIEYRILAGDGVTLWHRLTPLPRPRIKSFSKRYVFPDYARIPDQTLAAEHGDLQAIKGTVAHLTVHFSEPCTEASIRFIGGPLSLPMKPTNESQTDFSIAIPIREAFRYQVTTSSKQTGLSNPSGHQFSILPITDSPPVVAWSDPVEAQRIVSAVDKVPLKIQITDELPVDDVIQEYQINDGPIGSITLSVPTASRELELQSEFDLMMILDGNDETKLSGGDVVRTRIAVRDRAGQRGESLQLLLLIAEDGFAPSRDQRIDDLHDLAKRILNWTQQTRETLLEYSEFELPQLLSEDATNIDLRPPPEIAAALLRLIETAESPAAAERLELTGRATSDLDRKIQAWQTEIRVAGTVQDKGWGTDHGAMLDQLKQTPKRLGSESTNIENYVRNHLSHRLSIHLIDDATSLQRSLASLLQSEIADERIIRHLQIVDGRLKEIDQRFASHQDSSVDSSRQLSENWSNWRDRHSEKIKRAIEESFSVAAQRSVLEQIESELRSHQADKSVFNRQSSVGLIRGDKALRNQIGSVTSMLAAISNDGIRSKEAELSSKDANDSGESATLAGKARFYNEAFEDKLTLLLQRLEETKDLHAASPFADLPFLTDLGLLNSALTNVTKDGFVAYDGESAEQVFETLARAFSILEAGHEVTQWRNELRVLIAQETSRPNNAMSRFEHPQWLDRYAAGITRPIQTLRNSGIGSGTETTFNHSFANPNIDRAQQLLEPRRYRKEQIASARLPLIAAEHELVAYLDRLQPEMQSAREQIRRYVVPLHEQAREAAREVQEAVDQSESEVAEQEFVEADEATEQTMQALTDLANTQSTADREGLELARDADSALAQIGRQRDRVNEAKQDQSAEQVNDALDVLRQQLEETANHFERAEAGQDVSESRQRLRDAEKELDIDEQLEERFKKAKALAEASQMDAEELRKQLEQEANKNQAMRDELSEIARQTAESALDSLRQSAKDETVLNQALERADPEFSEQVQHLSDRLADLAQRLSSLEQIHGRAATDAAKEASLDGNGESLEQAREYIRSAAQVPQEVAGNQPSHSSIMRRAAKMANEVDSAASSVNEFNESLAVGKNEQSSDKQIRNEQRAAERRLQNVRNELLKHENIRKDRWNAALRDAKGRVQQAKQQIAANEKVAEQLRKSASDASPDDGLKQQIAGVQQRIDQAKRFEAATKTTVNKIESKLQATDKKIQELKERETSLSGSKTPSGDAARRIADQLASGIQQTLSELQEIGEQRDLASELDVPNFAAKQLELQQTRIRNEIDEIGNEIRRAALSEQRLGREDGARKLAESAANVKRVADDQASRAANAFERIAARPESATDAHQHVQQTLDGIDQVSNKLAELLGSMPTESGDPQAEASEQGQQQAKQLAQTLDELDQANAEDRDAPSDQTAGEASPTLDQAKQQSAREAAQQRRQQMNPKSGESADESKDSSSSMSGVDGETRSGDTTMPDGGPISIDGIDRLGKDWGYLRERRPTDGSDQPRSRIPAKYRLQIEAYFRAIAEQSARGER